METDTRNAALILDKHVPQKFAEAAIPHAQGEVTALIPIGETTLAAITWDTPDMPARVNVKNLVTVKRIAYE